MDAKINIRIEKSLKHKLDKLIARTDLTMSEYLRDVLAGHVHEEQIEDCYTDTSKSRSMERSKEILPNEYEQSFEFTQLIAWLFFRYMQPGESENVAIVKELKQRVELVLLESSFSRELKVEFLKVLSDINRFLDEPSLEKKYFFFSIRDNLLSFNYYMLLKEIWNLKS